jgi:hypothetical protein
MTDPSGGNPLIEATSDPKDFFPLIELKQHLVIFLEKPPSPREAGFVYEFYRDRVGDRIKKYRPTTPGCLLKDWNLRAQEEFESRELPTLRKRAHWGYWFWDGNPVNSWQFAFHGYRPVSETGWASFYRFEYDHAIDPTVLSEFAEALVAHIPFSSGYGGYAFYGRPSSNYEKQSYNRMFAWARRYWGVEAQDLDVTVKYVLQGYKCVNWITMIGNTFRSREPQAVERAKAVAFRNVDSDYGVLLQAEKRPRFGDRNTRERLEAYENIAAALLPLQLKEHGAFSGDLWTRENTMAWIRRFTHQGEVA